MTPDEALGLIEQTLASFAADKLNAASVVHTFRTHAERCRAEAAAFDANQTNLEAAVVSLANASNFDRLAEEIDQLPEEVARDGASIAVLATHEGEF